MIRPGLHARHDADVVEVMNLGQALPRRNHSCGLLASEFLLAHFIPPFAVFGEPLRVIEQCLVFRNGLIRSLERKVGGVVGQVEKEGLVPGV